MSVTDEVSAELESLGVDGWQRAVALRLAETVDESGTASAAGLLRTLMYEISHGAGTESPTGSAVGDIKSTLLAQQRQMSLSAPRRRSTPKSNPRKTIAVNKPLPRTNKRYCVDCGDELPPHVGRGRPRVRCAGGCQALPPAVVSTEKDQNE